MSYGMRRHTGEAQQTDERTPEVATGGAVYARAYGSAIHEAIKATEDGYDDDAAIQQAWNRYGAQLDPPDLQLLRDDLATYRTRDFPNTRLVAAEEEYRVPLLEHNGRRIYFRFKVDRLYERLDAPGVFIHVDYKSSKWPKSEAEVHSDLQLWEYNWGLHEVFPEIESLLQFYDQLRFGQIPTRKTPEQRALARDWLMKQVTAVLEDDDVRDDGLLRPTHNAWCAWCPIMESCPVVDELSEWALTRIAALAPERKEGRKTVVEIHRERIAEYAAELEKAKQAAGVLDRFQGAVRDVIRELPAAERDELGYELRGRRNRVFGHDAARVLHDELGDRFYELAKITKSGLEANLAEDANLLDWALGLADEQDGTPAVVRKQR